MKEQGTGIQGCVWEDFGITWERDKWMTARGRERV